MATTPTNNELSALIATLASQVVTLTSAVSPPGTTPTAFTLSSGRASSDDLIDYTTKLGGSMWNQSTKSLDTPYDMTSKHTVVFIEALANHAKVHGWAVFLSNRAPQSKHQHSGFPHSSWQ